MGLRRSEKRGTSLVALYLFLLWLAFEATLNVYGQERGFRYLKNYTRKEYGGQSQNWCILQGKHGIIYVGNQLGLLEFDGVTWRKIEVPNDFVRSMAVDDTGTIYVGGINEIGFLAPDSKGGLQYVSLLGYLDTNKRRFSDVWETHWTKQGIYFKTSKFLFRWNPNDKKIDVWESGNRFHLSFICNGKLFIRQENVGLMKMDTGTNSLIMIPGGETFAKKRIYMMVPYDNKKLLMGTRENGFYTYDIHDGIEAVPFPTGADNYLKENQLYHGIRLSSGDFAMATVRGGLVIMSSQGRLKEILNKSSGLQDDDVNYVFEDFQGNLWLAMDRGISKIEYLSPLSIYDDRSNLPGSVWSVSRHNKDLYAGTTRGLFFLASPHGFRPAAGISSYCWCLLSIEDTLLAATADGVFQFDGKYNIKHRVIENRSYFLLQSNREPHRIWVGTREGLVSLYSTGENKKGKWKKEHQFENITPQIRTIVEDKKGNLWLGTTTEGVLKVDFPGQDKINHPVVTQYHQSHGLPLGGIRVFKAADHVMFATDKGIFRFNEVNKWFIPDSTFGEIFSDGSRGVFRIVEDKNKNIWLHSDSRNFLVIPQPERDRGGFVIYKKPFLRIPDVQVNSIYPDPDGIVIWFASDDGLIRYNSHIKRNYDYNYPALIRKVLANGRLIFAGSQSNYKIEKDAKSTSTFPIFDYRVRTIGFEFAAPFFEAETRTQYQCILEGYDDHWSGLNSETRKDYINLDSGLYTFRVRGQNVYGHLSSEAVFQFKILLPWYRTWWAYLSYVLVLLMFTYLILKWWHYYKLEKEKQRLEQIVKERTKEINEKNQQLEEQSKKLKKIDKVKSRFFANISHEFRTPLTLIMGPLEQMLAADIENEMERKKNLTMMLRNSQRLLGLINQLLELSKFESGKVKLQACRQNIIPYLKGTVASFEPVANKYELDLRLQAEETNITLYFDPGKLEEVIFNLLSNAVKFTPAGGKITVTVTKKPSKEGNFPSGLIEISVCDTGPGIPREQLEHIFNRFYQLNSTYEIHGKGSGIGLALAKEMVELHHGEIEARSVEGEGTEFIIRLPMGDSHLKPEEIVQFSENAYKYKSLEEIPALFMMDEEQDVPVNKKGAPANIKAGTADSSETSATEEKDIKGEAQEKYIILVVEDSADFRNYIRGALEPLYTVMEAKDGREGIQKAQKIIPDLIICDIMMPEVDGYALCRVLKNDIKTSHIPLILLTAKAGEENIVKGLETGADDYITKPFSTKILCVRIKNLIDLRRQLQIKRKRQMTMQPAEIAVSSVDENFYKELQDVIEKNLSDSEFNVEQLGKKLYMSRASLYRKIMALTGESPLQFIRSYRLKRAAQLLKANFGNVTEVAVEVGFSNIAYFSQCFKEKFHQLPSYFHASEVES